MAAGEGNEGEGGEERFSFHECALPDEPKSRWRSRGAEALSTDRNEDDRADLFLFSSFSLSSYGYGSSLFDVLSSHLRSPYLLADTGYISGVKETPYWVNKFGTLDSTGTMVLTSGRDSLVTSILSAGTFCGALLSYPAGDLLGRRYGILAFLVLFVIGVALQTGAPGIATFVVGRVRPLRLPTSLNSLSSD